MSVLVDELFCLEAGTNQGGGFYSGTENAKYIVLINIIKSM